jgi:prevent-host-death family protein
MKKVSATELKTKTGQCLDTAQKEPVEIEKNGKVVAILIAREDYDRLARLENAYWLARIEAAEQGGYAGAEATSSFFKEMLSRNVDA